MGADQSKKNLTEEQIKECEDLAKGHSLFTAKEIREISVQIKKKTLNQEIKNVDGFLALLIHLKYFDRQLKNINTGLKAKLSSSEAKLALQLVEKAFGSKEFQLIGAQNLFKLFDRDHSGTISTTEFLSGFVIFLAGDPKEKVELTFDMWDADLSGTLTREELTAGWVNAFEQGMNAAKVMMAPQIMVPFLQKVISSTAKSLTAAESRFLDSLFTFTLKELGSIFDELTEAVKKDSKEIIDKLFTLDTNKDGVISRSEFVAGFDELSKGEEFKQLTAKIAKPQMDAIKPRLEKAFERWAQENADLLRAIKK